MPLDSSGFQLRIEQLKGSLVAQGRRVQSQLETAFSAVFAKDASKASQAIALDDEIDSVDVELERQSVALLTDATRESSHLEQDQLRWVLTIVKINNELERIADSAVDVAELVQPCMQSSVTFPDTFRVMANSCVGILRDTLTCLQRADPALAKVVLQSQHAVTAFKAALLRDAEGKIASGAMSVESAFRLHELASQCELIADHCTNMAEQIIYVTTGTIVRHTPAEWVEVRTQPKQG